MDCLVTGGAGFIGSHLVDRLIADGHQVVVYDNLSSGSFGNLAQHKGASRLKIVQADIRDLRSLTKAMRGRDFVFHLAADPIIQGGFEKRLSPTENNTIGTQNVLEAMVSCDIPAIAFSSSSTVYGEARVLPTPEDYGPLLPISLYAASKLACEGMITAYSHGLGFRYWIFRFANIVGSRMTHGVVYDFVHKLKSNPEELEILGNGKQRKAFLLADECVDAMLHCISCVENDIFNLGAPTAIDVTNVAQIVVEEMGLEGARFRYTGGTRGWAGDVPDTVLCIQKLLATSWKPANDSVDAVQATTRLLAGLA